MTKVETRMVQAAMKHGYTYTWQSLKFGYRRMMIECGNYDESKAVEDTFRRMRGVVVKHWYCFEGIFEGYVYVMDAEQAEELERAMKAERARLEDWWMRYHRADTETRAMMACGAIQ